MQPFVGGLGLSVPAMLRKDSYHSIAAVNTYFRAVLAEKVILADFEPRGYAYLADCKRPVAPSAATDSVIFFRNVSHKDFPLRRLHNLISCGSHCTSNDGEGPKALRHYCVEALLNIQIVITQAQASQHSKQHGQGDTDTDICLSAACSAQPAEKLKSYQLCMAFPVICLCAT